MFRSTIILVFTPGYYFRTCYCKNISYIRRTVYFNIQQSDQTQVNRHVHPRDPRHEPCKRKRGGKIKTQGSEKQLKTSRQLAALTSLPRHSIGEWMSFVVFMSAHKYSTSGRTRREKPTHVRGRRKEGSGLLFLPLSSEAIRDAGGVQRAPGLGRGCRAHTSAKSNYSARGGGHCAGLFLFHSMSHI